MFDSKFFNKLGKLVWCNNTGLLRQHFNTRRDLFRRKNPYLGYLTRTMEQQLLNATNRRHFRTAEFLFWKIQSLAKLKVCSNSEKNKFVTRPMPDLIHFGSLSDNQLAIIKACFKIAELLDNPTLCISLLKELDSHIAFFEPILKCDFTKITPGAGMFLHQSLRVPRSLPLKNSVLISNTHGLLRWLIRNKLQQHGIETQDELYIFSGFVKPFNANAIIRSGALFKEQFLTGTSLLHGIYSHYLQWYLLAVAYEKKILKFEKNVTLKDILINSVDIYSMHQSTSLWEITVDFLAFSPDVEKDLNFGLGSPHRLNSVLLFSKQIPHLRGYMLNSFYKNNKKIIAYVKSEYNEKISYPCIVGAQAVAFQIFDGVNLGCVHSREHVRNNLDISHFHDVYISVNSNRINCVI